MRKPFMICGIFSITILISFFIFMAATAYSGDFYVETIEGDKAHLDEFEFEFKTGDATHGYDVTFKDGEFSRDYSSENYIEQSFNTHYYLRSYNVSVHLNIAEGSTIELSHDIPEELQAELTPSPDSKGFEITKADELDVLLEVSDFENQLFSYFETDLKATNGPYYFYIEYLNDGTSHSLSTTGYDSTRNNISTQEIIIDGNYYALVTPVAYLSEGEPFQFSGNSTLVKISHDELSLNAPYSFVETADAQEPTVLASFPVNENEQPIGFASINDEYLLVLGYSEDELYFVLYDLEGNLVSEYRTEFFEKNQFYNVNLTVYYPENSENPIIYYSLNEYEGIRSTHGLLLFSQDKLISLYEEEGSTIYNGQNTLLGVEFAMYKDGKLLTVERESSIDPILLVLSETSQEYYLNVYDTENGNELLYRGELITDFNEDYKNRIASRGGGLDENSYVDDSLYHTDNFLSDVIHDRTRIIFDFAPLNGRSEHRWLR